MQNCSTQEVCRFIHMSRASAKWDLVKVLILGWSCRTIQCGVEFYVLTTPDWDLRLSHNIPRYLEQNVDAAVMLNHSNSEDKQWTKIESRVRQSRSREP